MDITRHNYEEYFILYIDNELNAAERKAVEFFVQENPDLEEELVMLQQSVIRPEGNLVFAHKENLLKNTAGQGLVNESNYEEYFVLYGDDELTNEEKDLVEQFVYRYPQYQVEFELIQQARLFPQSISFPDKTYLYRTEEDDNKVVPFGWWRMAAAAVVLLVVGSFGLYIATQDDITDKPAVVVIDKKKTTPEVKPEITRKEVEPTIQVAENEPVAEKKSTVASNIYKQVNVQYKTEEPLKPVEEPAINETHLIVKPVDAAVGSYTASVTIAQPSISEPAPAMAIAAATPDDMNDQKTYVLNTSVNKTPLRGFFRKVSRVIDKATSFEVSENEKGGVRIANLELALK